MKHIIYQIIGSAAALLAAFSCSDKLDIEQHGVLTYDNFYNTDEQIIEADASLYTLFTGYSYEFNIIKTLNVMTDDFIVGGASYNAGTGYNEINAFHYDADNENIKTLFQTYMGEVFQANVILGHVAEGTATANMARAEAKVMRAWSYFNLTTLWGTPPIVDHELSVDEYSQPNATREELWAFIEKDLTEAISSGALSEKSSVNDANTWRVTKQFAQAILGKAYLWQGKNSEAAAQFDSIVNSGLYALYSGNYEDILRTNFTSESLFEGSRMFNASNPTKNTNYWKIFCGWRYDQLNHVAADSTLEAVSTNNTPFAMPGYGRQIPTPSLYEAFVADEGTDGYRLNSTMLTYSQIGEKLSLVVPPAGTYYGYGYFMWKTRVLKEDTSYGQSVFYNKNDIVMRYPEVLLLGAEAHLALGETDKALEYVNMVRERAQLADLSTITLNDIKTEKRLELCAEGLRFQDLVRWGDAAEAMAENGKEYPALHSDGSVTYTSTGLKEYGFQTGVSELLPFPATEVRLNNKIKQNPGY